MIKFFIMFMVIFFPISAFADSRLDNCLPYKEEISSILESEGVSSDYFYLAVCESGCKIKMSSKGARSFFQVMPATYRHYKPDGCSIEDIDDIECSTRAAARYIKHLQKRFKEISILVKAYNRGGTNLLRKGTTREADGLSYCVMKFLRNKKNN